MPMIVRILIVWPVVSVIVGALWSCHRAREKRVWARLEGILGGVGYE